MKKQLPKFPSNAYSKPFSGYNQPFYTQVPDQLFDEQLPDLSGAELKVLLYIMRRTFGFKKDRDNISLTQIGTGIKKKDGTRLDRGTGLHRETVISALKSLEKKGIIISTRNASVKGDYDATTYRPNILDGQKQRHQADSEEGSRKIRPGGSRKIRPPYTRDSNTRNRLKNSNSEKLEKSERPKPRTGGVQRIGDG